MDVCSCGKLFQLSPHTHTTIIPLHITNSIARLFKLNLFATGRPRRVRALEEMAQCPPGRLFTTLLLEGECLSCLPGKATHEARPPS
jgi:hypothetical protein